MEPVTYEMDGLTAIIRINRPDKLNALDETVIKVLERRCVDMMPDQNDAPFCVPKGIELFP